MDGDLKFVSQKRKFQLQSLIQQQTGTPADEELFKELKVVDRLTSIGYYAKKE